MWCRRGGNAQQDVRSVGDWKRGLASDYHEPEYYGRQRLKVDCVWWCELRDPPKALVRLAGPLARPLRPSDASCARRARHLCLQERQKCSRRRWIYSTRKCHVMEPPCPLDYIECTNRAKDLRCKLPTRFCRTNVRRWFIRWDEGRTNRTSDLRMIDSKTAIPRSTAELKEQ